MTGALKIRILLLVLALAFLGTALTLHYSFDKAEILHRDAGKIQERLRQKEEFVLRFLNTRQLFDSLKTIHTNPLWVQNLVPGLQNDHQVYLLTYQNNKLRFWSSIDVLFESDAGFKEGSTFLSWKNGWYELIKKSEGSFSAIALIPVKSNYPYQNQYLENKFADDLISSGNLEIAAFNDHPSLSIRNAAGKYLFSVKLRSEALKNFYSQLELLLLLLGIASGLVLVNMLCIWIAGRGHLLLSIAFLASFLLGFRLLDLENPWFDTYFRLEIFDPKYYASGYFFPSLGDFILNMLAVTWLMGYIYSYRQQLKLNGQLWKPWGNYLAFGTTLIFVYFCGYLIDRLFYGLIINSSISFNVSNVLNLNWVSWLGIGIFCFLALNFYLLLQTAFAITEPLLISVKNRLIIFLLCLMAGVFIRLMLADINWFFLLVALVLFLSGWAYYQYRRHFNLGIFVFILLVFATGASLKLAEYELIKEKEARKLIAAKLISADDPNAVVLFLDLEKELLTNELIADQIRNPIANHDLMAHQIQRLYFSGYLSRFDFDFSVFNQAERLLKGEAEISLAEYRELVLSRAVKVSEYFYRVSNTFGFQHYFALIPVNNNAEKLGTLVLELKSKELGAAYSAPGLLVDGKIKEDIPLQDYSYAYYRNSRLVNQYGNFVYNLGSDDFKGKLLKDIFIERKDLNGKEYSHLLFMPAPNKLIVISKETDSILKQLASVSFMFLVLLLFSSAVFLFKWIWFSFLNFDIRFRNFRWNYLLTTNRVLYKTRIQVSMVATVVFTLLVTGFITYLNIRDQYREQQEEEIVERLKRITNGLGREILQDGRLKQNKDLESIFNDFAGLNGTDLNLFDLNGNLVLTSQPKIYANGLIAPKMSSNAYLFLSLLQKSEFVNMERIGSSEFISAYMPIRNSANVTVAYLSLPYFTNEQDYEEQLGEFINALVNVYALVFVAIGFFAVFVANRITSPLTLIQKNLSQIQIGQRNEPIVWKRNDEIGNLIKEYNNMIGALEESTLKLARSERETAWREMAKQVAHEIKNPLTPLKLGVQLLEKSWKEEDPNFNKKFERFSKSFVEQIESLARIASEFSNFAKMPETVFEELFVPDILQQAVILHHNSARTAISVANELTSKKRVLGDKEQLLRCFGNLIKNATEAQREGQKVMISIRLFNTAKNIFVEIHDNGTGISENAKAQIFTPNFTTKSSGTGLGLAFVKQALENMGGNISYRTQLNKGTTFYINIPYAT